MIFEEWLTEENRQQSNLIDTLYHDNSVLRDVVNDAAEEIHTLQIDNAELNRELNHSNRVLTSVAEENAALYGFIRMIFSFYPEIQDRHEEQLDAILSNGTIPEIVDLTHQ